MIPFIPADAPFTTDQRSWLAGFLAGMQTRLLATGPDTTSTAGSAPALHVLYGSQTGNAESVAEDTAAAAARSHGFAPTVCALDDIDVERFAALGRVLIVTSTYGEGEMPDNAELFWDALSAESAPRLENMDFAVLALGDTGYDGFCEAGKLIDMRLEQLGAQRIVARVDCDVDFEDVAAAWIAETLPLVAAVEGIHGGGAAPAPVPVPARTKSQWNRKNPFPATVTVNRLLSGGGSGKEIRHYEFDLAESGLEYEAGDALNVVPVNDSELVQHLLKVLRLDGTVVPAGHERTLTDLLTHNYEITAPNIDLLEEVEKRTRNEELTYVLRHGDKAVLDDWLWGRDILDVLRLEPTPELSAEEFLSLLKPLQHRAYSISSSPNATEQSVHLTVAAVRYGTDGRERRGVCSTFLADRIGAHGTAGVFVTKNKAFRVPTDDTAPMIMVGPGTGIAPFRGFLQERRARGATGRNWLLFGDQRRACDFVYEEELAEFVDSGVLTRLDLAFSRDQAEKIYVQTRMKEHGAELFAWLEGGGHFYICGDASRMAKDVDRALHEIVAEHGGLSPDGAADYVTALKREKRYVRDVY
ncbi:MAG: sulfite reductase subunit alpha [Rhodococcus sp. (in: high G+C Gram-positive bacteria)]|uniref:sulfite reductase subunit alpha n=1 Tax=Rhodococcus sp. TaxID=1831 RepID=UPI003BB4D1E6